MSQKISVNSLFVKHYLVVTDKGVKFYEGAIFASTRRFRFDEISCVLMAPDNQLSFQVRNEVFSIPSNPRKPKHQAAVDALVKGVELSAVRAKSSVH